MKLRTPFRSEEELTQRLGQHFMDRWHLLLAEYHRVKRLPTDGARFLRMASLAFAFYGAALDGDADIMYHFDDIVHGVGQEFIEVDGRPLILMEDDLHAQLMWDTAALILEEEEPSRLAPQCAYDEVGKHVMLAYKLPAESPIVQPVQKAEEKPVQNVTVEESSAKEETPASQPEQPQEADALSAQIDIAWIIQWALEQQNPTIGKVVTQMLSDHYLSQNNPQLYQQNMDIRRGCDPDRLQRQELHDLGQQSGAHIQGDNQGIVARSLGLTLSPQAEQLLLSFVNHPQKKL